MSTQTNNIGVFTLPAGLNFLLLEGENTRKDLMTRGKREEEKKKTEIFFFYWPFDEFR